MVVAPADGKVILTDEVIEERYLNGPARRVAIFMNVFDVHVNRAPATGTVREVEHREGCFKAAFREDAGTLNEQMALVLEEGGRCCWWRRSPGCWPAHRLVCPSRASTWKRGSAWG